MFPSSIDSGSDVYVWQLLASLGLSSSDEQQIRLVIAVKDRVTTTVNLAKTFPPTKATEHLSGVDLFLRSMGLNVEVLME